MNEDFTNLVNTWLSRGVDPEELVILMMLLLYKVCLHDCSGDMEEADDMAMYHADTIYEFLQLDVMSVH